MHFTNQPILRDFDRFLDLLGQSKRLELTRDRGHLRQAELLKINESLHFPAHVFGAKSQQPAFSLITTFYYIARTALFFSVKKSGQAKDLPVLVLNEERVRQFDGLTDDEKYFFLLESFWCFLDWDEAFDVRVFSDDRFYVVLAAQPVGEWVSVGDHDLKRAGKIIGPMSTSFAEIFQAFGFLDLIWDETLEKKPTRYQFPYRSAAITEIGKTMLPTLFEKRSQFEWGERNPFFSNEIAERMELEADEADSDEAFANAFLPLFDGLKIENELYPIVRPFVAGSYSFRVSLGADCFREIAISGEAPLDDLHGAIQSAFKFDDDHLYAFYMDGRKRSFAGEIYLDPGNSEDGLPADVFRLGELGLYAGKEFLYLFDFGASWEFVLLVLDIEPGATMGGGFKLIRSVGKAPKQYEKTGNPFFLHQNHPKMAKNTNAWGWVKTTSPAKPTAARKAAIEVAFVPVIANFKANLPPLAEPQQWNQCVDVFSKWHGSYFYIMARYKCSPGATAEGFDTGMARLTFQETDSFDLAYFRHTGNGGCLPKAFRWQNAWNGWRVMEILCPDFFGLPAFQSAPSISKTQNSPSKNSGSARIFESIRSKPPCAYSSSIVLS